MANRKGAKVPTEAEQPTQEYKDVFLLKKTEKVSVPVQATEVELLLRNGEFIVEELKEGKKLAEDGSIKLQSRIFSFNVRNKDDTVSTTHFAFVDLDAQQRFKTMYEGLVQLNSMVDTAKRDIRILDYQLSWFQDRNALVIMFWRILGAFETAWNAIRSALKWVLDAFKKKK